MLSSMFHAQCLLIFFFGPSVLGSPIAQNAVPGDSYFRRPGVGFLANVQDFGHPNGKRDASPNADPAASLWGLSIPTLFSRASNTTSPNISLNADETAGLNLHNAARASKGLKPLAWDPSLQAQALSFAKLLMWGTSLTHSPSFTRPNQGENLAFIGTAFMLFNTEKNPITAATNGWLAEAPFYKGEVIPQGSFGNYSHYTQCMWNATDRVGITAISGWLGGWWVVARYSPAGNIIGEKPY